MKKKERIKELERRVAELERRLYVLEVSAPLQPIYTYEPCIWESKDIPLIEVKVIYSVGE